MKNFVVTILLLAFAAGPAYSDDAAAKVSAKKPATVAPADHKHAHHVPEIKDDCANEHGMADHHGHGMMEGAVAEMMMEPDMHLLGALALTKEQQSKIHKLADELKHKNWATQGLLNDETAALRDLYEADKRDPATIGKEYQKVFDLKRQMIETYLDIQNRIEEVLTADQVAKMKDARHDMHHMSHHAM